MAGDAQARLDEVLSMLESLQTDPATPFITLDSLPPHRPGDLIPLVGVPGKIGRSFLARALVGDLPHR